jgi:N-acetylmuramate 1-kinase
VIANTTFDTRLAELSVWVRQQLASDDARVEVASADASFRRYFRVRATSSGGKHSCIVMDAPPDKENVHPFINVASILESAGVNAPRVVSQDLDRGYLLLTDLGNRTYLSALTQLCSLEMADRLYDDALRALLQMQLATARDSRIANLPTYDIALLRREMELFPDWFLQRHLGLTINASFRQQFDAAFTLLIESALAQPQVFVHRDYHSRNLMLTEGAEEAFGANPGVLDFQDAVVGPITYDLVSLLRDCYVDWPVDYVRAWATRYLQRAQANGLVINANETQWLRWFDLMGVQRHFKAIGIFARLWHRDGKPGYLNDIPRTLGYIRTVASNYPELQPLTVLLETQVVPALERSRAP